MAASALGQLVTLSTRIEPLVKELNQTAGNVDDLSENTAILDALWRVYDAKGGKVSSAGCEQTVEILSEVPANLDENVRLLGAKALAKVLQYLPEELKAEQVEQLVVAPVLQDLEWFEQHGHIILFTEALHTVPASLLDLEATIPAVLQMASSENVTLRQAIAAVLATLLSIDGLELPPNAAPQLLEALRSCLEDSASEVRLGAMDALKSGARRSPASVIDKVRSILDVAVKMSKTEKSEEVKQAASHFLFYGFQLQSGQDVLQTFLKSCKDADLTRQLTEHSKRVLSKLDVDDL